MKFILVMEVLVFISYYLADLMIFVLKKGDQCSELNEVRFKPISTK